MGEARKQIIPLNLKTIELLNEFDCFSGLDQKEWNFLQEDIFIHNVKENEILIHEGTNCEFIYFLISGRVSSHVKNQKTAVLQRRGDVIGGLTSFSNSSSLYTYISEIDSEFLAIPTESIANSPSNVSGSFFNHIYKIFAMNLGERLDATSLKVQEYEFLNAKFKEMQLSLEDLNKSLESKVNARTKELAYSNIALRKSYEKLEQLYAQRSHTFNRLLELKEVHIKNLTRAIKKAEQVDGENIVLKKNYVENLKSSLGVVSEYLDQVNDHFKTDVILKNKNVIFLEENTKVAVDIKFSLSGVEANFVHVSTIPVFLENISEKSYDVVLIAESFLKDIDEEVLIENNVIVILPSNYKKDISLIPKLNHINHLIHLDQYNHFFNMKNIVTTMSKTLEVKNFNISEYLGVGTKFHEREITGSLQRREVLDEMKEFFNNSKMRNGIFESINLVAEELLMNLVYDAPVDENGVEKYNKLSRTSKVELEENEYGIVRYAQDGFFAAIVAIDPFGRLDKSEIYKRLTDQKVKVRENSKEKGGAGIGLYQIFKLSDMVIFEVEKGVRSEVMALFLLDRKKHSTQNEKSISVHFFNDAGRKK